MAKTVSLVLGSGGARGYAHIGVIEVLEEKGYKIKAISGASMGALVGGVYAAGKLPEFKEWASDFSVLGFIKLLDFSLREPGAIRGERLFKVIKEMVGDVKIQNLPIEFTAVATDLISQKEVWFQQGSLTRAMRASISIPSLFTPVSLKGMLLVDGGVLNPLPIIPTVSAHADMIVAVDLAGKESCPTMMNADDAVPLDEQEMKQPETESLISTDAGKELINEYASHDFSHSSSLSLDTFSDLFTPEIEALVAEHNKPEDVDWWEGFKTRTSRWYKSLQTAVDEGPQIPMIKMGRIDVIHQAIDTMQSSLAKYKVAGYPPDVMIQIPAKACGTLDFQKAEELIQLGRECAERAL
ncbi:patatin-like phospholipase family protein [Litoribacillus peritrichatus]|uniref:Patatin-like phospholipase family protein n=1 Tax=Litoribacillus peritrichatus TaxID=718191 RepID=A0ABP7MDJ1_9GAMM